MIIDAHQHFWRYNPNALPWIAPHMNELMRDWLPTDLEAELATCDVDATVVVQACGDEADTHFLMEQANAYGWIAGVVGWVDLTALDVGNRIDYWADIGPLVGLRHQLEDEPKLLANDAFDRGVNAVQARGLIYEVLVNAAQLGEAVRFCARHDHHTLVVDHLAKPAIADNEAAFEAWQRAMASLAAMPHVAVKLSGLVTEARCLPDGTVDFNAIRRHLDTAMELFGPYRVLFGSDWPVCRLVASYQTLFSFMRDWAKSYDAHTTRALFGGNAASLYDLTLNSDKT